MSFKTVRNRETLIGFGVPQKFPIVLDPGIFEGAIIYAEDGVHYGSDGVEWNPIGVGTQGLQGVQGPQGIQGIQGIQGLIGFAVRIIGSVDDVNVSPPDDPNTLLEQEFPERERGDGVIDTLTRELWVYDDTEWVNVGIIQGPQGIQGIQGPQGIQGFQGIQGRPYYINWKFVDENYTAEDGDGIVTDTSSAPLTISLPHNPEQGDVVLILDGSGTFAINPITVDRNGSTIENFTSNVELDIARGRFEFVYDGSTWKIFANIGPQGLQGTQGEMGAQGLQGLQGNRGIQGIQGETGIQGLQGDLGPIGEQGIQGLDGSFAGQGIQGLQGDLGPIGEQGIQGTDGINGPQGVQGIQGLQGIDGSLDWVFVTDDYTASDKQAIISDTSGGSFTITLPENPSVGEIIVIVDNNDWEVNPVFVDGNTETIEGSSENLVLDITKVRVEVVFNGSTWKVYANIGKEGIQGIAGEPGVQGFPGFSGAQGIQGLDGEFAGQGIQGLQGLDGEFAAQGIQGLDGEFAGQGIQGIQGLKGLDGEFAAQGIQGLDGEFAGQGIQGIQGLDGEFAAQGIQGLDGEFAGQGIQGLQGISGFIGAQGVQGLDGEFAAQGVQGLQGLDGEFAAQGIQGLDGAFAGQGIQGTDGFGFQGIQGVQGLDGEFVAQGVQGADGFGFQGIQGVQGQSGIQGVVGESIDLLTAGDTAIGSIRYASTTRTGGQFYGGGSNPASTTRLNYDGNFHATSITATSNLTVSGTSSFSGDLNLNNTNRIINLNTPSNNSDAATKLYVDQAVQNAGGNDVDLITVPSNAIGAVQYNGTTKFTGRFYGNPHLDPPTSGANARLGFDGNIWADGAVLSSFLTTNGALTVRAASSFTGFVGVDHSGPEGNAMEIRSGHLNMFGNRIRNVANPVLSDGLSNAVNVRYGVHSFSIGSNGGYVRFGNGMQIAWRTDVTLTFNSSNNLRTDWAFPASFTNSPSISATINLSNTSTNVSIRDLNAVTWINSGNNNNVARLVLYARTGDSFLSGNTARVQVVAIGRWSS